MNRIQTITGSEGRRIDVRVWEPNDRPSKVIVLSHGMGEHIDRYAAFGEYCQERGIAVIGANHRGHGSEAEMTGHFADEDGWQLVVEDLAAIINCARSHFEKPVILVGHSMGSFIARYYAIVHGDTLDGLVLCGSNYQPSWFFSIAAAIAKTQVMMFGKRHRSRLMEVLSFGSFNMSIKNARTDMDWLNSDETEVNKYIADPLCGFTCTAQFWVDFLSGIAWSSKGRHLTAIDTRLPIWVVSGERDPVSRMKKGAQALTAKLTHARVSDVSLKLYPQARHELFNESIKEQFYEDLLSWAGRVE